MQCFYFLLNSFTLIDSCAKRKKKTAKISWKKNKKIIPRVNSRRNKSQSFKEDVGGHAALQGSLIRCLSVPQALFNQCTVRGRSGIRTHLYTQVQPTTQVQKWNERHQTKTENVQSDKVPTPQRGAEFKLCTPKLKIKKVKEKYFQKHDITFCFFYILHPARQRH